MIPMEEVKYDSIHILGRYQSCRLIETDGQLVYYSPSLSIATTCFHYGEKSFDGENESSVLRPKNIRSYGPQKFSVLRTEVL